MDVPCILLTSVGSINVYEEFSLHSLHHFCTIGTLGPHRARNANLTGSRLSRAHCTPTQFMPTIMISIVLFVECMQTLLASSSDGHHTVQKQHDARVVASGSNVVLTRAMTFFTTTASFFTLSHTNRIRWYMQCDPLPPSPQPGTLHPYTIHCLPASSHCFTCGVHAGIADKQQRRSPHN